MARIYKKIIDLIGNTPLLELVNYNKKHGLSATVIAKLEYFNPAGSVKDRIAKAMIEDAEEKPSQRGLCHNRAHQRQHRDRSGLGRHGQGLSDNPHHA